jgi:glycosyltransferase involved in cell wall biosynthesis
MKILIVTHYFLPHKGGIEFVAYNQAKELVKQGHQVTIVSSKIGDEPEEEIMDGIKIRRVRAWNIFEKKWGIPYPVFSLKLSRVLNQEAKDADVVHVHDIGYLSSWNGTRKAIKYSKKLILMQHITTVKKGFITNLIQFIVQKTYGKYIINKADKIIVCNELVKNWINKPEKTIFLHNAVDIKLFKPTTKENISKLKKKYNLPLDKPIVIFVGRLVDKKGFQKLFESRDKDYFILFVGDGEIPEYMQNQENTKFISAQPQNKLSELYALSNIFCLPSINEGFPLTILEAMACALPIITTDHEGYDKYLDKNKTMLIEPTSENIKSSIKNVLKDKKKLELMRKYSYSEAIKRFNWSKNVDKLLEVYKE